MEKRVGRGATCFPDGFCYLACRRQRAVEHPCIGGPLPACQYMQVLLLLQSFKYTLVRKEKHGPAYACGCCCCFRASSHPAFCTEQKYSYSCFYKCTHTTLPFAASLRGVLAQKLHPNSLVS
eukprot:scaffold56079_cov19-Tisochrysis_lutea.AAC.3